MIKYSIKDLEKFSGIKAHTIRIWEQRYQLLTPKRTETNIRYYDEDQLKYLLNVTLLLEHGFRISQICAMTGAEFNAHLKEVAGKGLNSKEDNMLNAAVNELVLAMLELDEQRFEKIMSSSLLQRSFEEVLIKVIYPFLKRIGVMWRIGEVSTAQEHFIYQLIRQKIIVAIDSLIVRSKSSEKYLLFLPKSEFSDLLILLFTYILKNRGKQCIYLGADIPFKDLQQVAQITKPDVLFTFVKAPASKLDTQAYIYELSEKFGDKQILISGNPYFMEELEYPKNVLLILEANDLIEMLTD
ncbi:MULTISPECIES: MerR family transcriptional regulator [Roseivirga]|jgi:DNA-binding transcriptional MerR regulator|uniref:MerR family transcriptional regulator n=1 Tax=Roseivirga thermotolerans TaxID=1758176 RepID=A0ABQ3I0F5_9BACT|nr:MULTISPECIES: MerR family transcriptional regulator [Roseivirga]MEC7752954.1 MerR family transcriptional regulator [Bacteroidota bacterium]GHE52956.1 MerR family transcriptional regulator [Roseivirga thermotolerans]|tara:strand:- start:74375 stop:75268 length:894 start_codon:yes stop_codon:yes gene_type:complete